MRLRRWDCSWRATKRLTSTVRHFRSMAASLRRCRTRASRFDFLSPSPGGCQDRERLWGAPKRIASEPRISGLDRIGEAVELAQVGEPAHGEPMRIALAGLEQGVDVLRHLFARYRGRFRRAVHQKIVCLHDAIACGFQ